MGRGDLTDAEWEQLRPFLPVSNRRCGRWRDHRQVIAGILQQIQAAADRYGEVDGDISVDSITVRAHQHAAGARIAPPAPVPKGRGSELPGEAARLSLCDRLAEVVQAPKGSAAHAAGPPPRST